MSPAAWVFLIVLLLFLVLIVGVALRRREPAVTCPRCRRAGKPGFTFCPYCGAPYGPPKPSVDVTTSSPQQLHQAKVPQLVVLKGPEVGQQFPLTGEEQFSIGRSGDNRLRLSGQLVSRHHALITFQNGQYVLYDRDSTNGTYVNGQRIAQHVLRHGDRIQIGPTVLEFRFPDVPVVKSPTPTPQPVGVASPVPLNIPHLRDYVITPLKQGGAAVIYKGVSRDGRQTVAIKVLRHTDPYIRQKFADEARILRTLNHPHIAKAYDYGQINGSFYFVMEYCDGGSLRDRLVGGRPLPLDFVTSVIGQICEALEYAHRHGVIHRDIKPENILFVGQDFVKVVDFGIAKLAGQITHTVDGMVIGTPHYLSYEQARGLPVDHRSDVYSLGVVLYEMTTGRVPFSGDALEVVRKHLTELPPPPRRFNPDVPPHIEQAVLRALHKDRRQRFQSAMELATAIGYRGAMAEASQEPDWASQVGGAPARSLLITTGPLRGHRIPLTGGQMELGRRTVNPKDLQISRRHARVLVREGTFWLEDLNSANGTFHNGRRIFGPVLLQGGDEVRIGNTVLRVEG